MYSLTHEEIVELLLRHGMISEDQLAEAQVISRVRDLSVLDSSILSGFVDEHEVQNLVSDTLGIAQYVLNSHESATTESDNRCPLCDFHIKVAYTVGRWVGDDPETGRNVYGSIYGTRCNRCFTHLKSIDADVEAIRSIREGVKEYSGNIRWKSGQ